MGYTLLLILSPATEKIQQIVKYARFFALYTAAAQKYSLPLMHPPVLVIFLITF